MIFVRFYAENISLTRYGRVLCHELSFSLKTGEGVMITGANGAGKTSLLCAAAGLLPLASGRIGFAADEASHKKTGLPFHYIAHANGLAAGLSVFETLDFYSQLLGGKRLAAKEFARLLDFWTLAAQADDDVARLSAGQARKLALARLHLAPAPLWLLDEPAAALDAEGQAVLARACAAHRHNGGLILAAQPVAAKGWRQLAL